MKTYQFTAFRDECYAASGEVQAHSLEEAKAKIIERYHDERACIFATTSTAISRTISC